MLSFKYFNNCFLILTFFLLLASGCKKKDNPKIESPPKKKLDITTTIKPISTSIICDKFIIKWDIKGENLNFWLDTDLPNETDIMVSVSRDYWEKGSPGTYSVDYFSEKSTVGKYRTQKQISVEDKVWKDALKSKQNKMSGFGLGFEVGKIGKEIEVSFIVPIRQSSSRFGEKNINLDGKAVTKTGLRIVKDEIKISKKLGSNFSGGSSISTSPLSLEVGRTYIISKKTPLMPELNPTNPLEAIKIMIELSPYSTIKILKSVKKDNSPWYNVDAKSGNKNVGKGWINSTALLGQNLKVK